MNILKYSVISVSVSVCCLFDLTSVHPKVILDMNGLVGCDVIRVFLCVDMYVCVYACECI